MKIEVSIPTKLIVISLAVVVLAGGVVALAQSKGWIDVYLFRGHSVTVTLENDGAEPIFAHIDNTGRHDDNFPVDTLPLPPDGSRATPPGELVMPGEKKSFGKAIGLFDFSTLHLWKVSASGTAANLNPYWTCQIDTLRFAKIPFRIHVDLVWNGRDCMTRGAD